MADPYYQTPNSQAGYYHPGGQQQQQYYQQQPINPNYVNPVSGYSKTTTSAMMPGNESSNLYMALVGMSDSFLAAGQPRLAIHCLESVLTIKSHDLSIATSLHIQLRTRLNLARLYVDYTINTTQLANAHIEKAMLIIQNLNANDELKYEATLTLYELFERQRDMQSRLKLDTAASGAASNSVDASQMTSLFSLDLVRKVLETAKAFPLWHIRIIYLIGVCII